jgi:crotonobetainyl-CoA:carnitine CoA-transferase CaiB-like acyl-CoA transferase
LFKAEGRIKYHDELDAAITGWTIGRQDHEAMLILQKAGVPAGPSHDISQVFNDPQLREGGYISTVQTLDGESREMPGLPWRFQGEQDPILTEAPVLGQHNSFVYQELLGMSEQEARRLAEEQVIY